MLGTEAHAAPNLSGAKQVSVIFSKEQFDTLQRLADMQGITLADALRQAIDLSELIVTANADPETRILLKKGNSTDELKIVR